MQNKLWAVRLKSFLVSAGSLFGTAILAVAVGVLASPDFMALVKEYAGTGFIGSLVVLIVPEIVKHITNKVAIGKAAEMFGAEGAVDNVTLI